MQFCSSSLQENYSFCLNWAHFHRKFFFTNLRHIYLSDWNIIYLSDWKNLNPCQNWKCSADGFLRPGVFLLARSDVGCLGQTMQTHTDWRFRDISCLFQHSKFQIHGTTGCIRITVAIHEFFADEILRKMTWKEPVRLKSALCTSRVTHWHRNLLSCCPCYEHIFWKTLHIFL